MAENYVLLESVVLTSRASYVTFDNLPASGYTDLKIIGTARGFNAATYASSSIVFNGDTGANYRRTQIEGGDGSVTTFVNTSDIANISVAYFSGGNATANAYGTIEIDIPEYKSSKYKTFTSLGSGEHNAGTGIYMDIIGGRWNNTAPITSIRLGPDFEVGTVFSLYGLAATGTTPTVGPFASGGNIIANDGTYWYHAFSSSGTFTPAKAITADILQVAGGGGGGANNGGGGGAGGLLVLTSQSLSVTNYTVTVGAGGAGSPGNAPRGANGTNSQFASLTAAVGGGGGGSYFDLTPGNGGSGGGGGANAEGGSASGGSPTSGQGYAGGNGQAAGNPNHAGGGGGGAGGAGANGNTQPNGGVGSSAYSSWGLATTTGENSSGTVYYAGGGGGARSNQAGGTGGTGGGGNGGGTVAQKAGTATTGGGGGAQPNQGTGSNTGGKAGGSGIVIIRYAMV